MPIRVKKVSLAHWGRINEEAVIEAYIEEMLKSRSEILLIRGVPGAGKTRLVLRNVYRMYRRGMLSKVVIAVSHRKLRDYIANNMLPLVSKVIRGRDEVCDKIANRPKGIPYLVHVAATCSKCPLYKKVECPFFRQFRELKKMDEGVIVTTHKMSIIVSLVFKPQVIVIDEAEEFIGIFAEPVDPALLDEIKSIDEEMYMKLKANMIEYNNKYYLHPRLLHYLGVKSIMISATFPDELEQELYHFFNIGRRIEKEYWILTHTIRTENRDILIGLDRIIVWEKGKELKDQPWYRNIISGLTTIVSKVIEKYGVIGIASKNKMMTKGLHDLFTTLGYRVTSDYYHDKPDTNAEIYIVTTRGKWYRGISLRPRKVRSKYPERKDFPVLVAFYQRQTPDAWVRRIPPFILEQIGGDVGELNSLVRTLVMGDNVQTIFRFNRYRRLPHIIIALDKRLVKAISTMLSSYAENLKHKETVDTVDKLVRRVLELLDEYEL